MIGICKIRKSSNNSIRRGTLKLSLNASIVELQIGEFLIKFVTADFLVHKFPQKAIFFLQMLSNIQTVARCHPRTRNSVKGDYLNEANGFQ